jgi:hypothetical protein
MSHKEINFIDEMEKDDAWLKAHLEEIVDRYAHKVIAILDQEIVGVGESISGVQQQIAEQYPARVPLVFEVPSREDLRACCRVQIRAYSRPTVAPYSSGDWFWREVAASRGIQSRSRKEAPRLFVHRFLLYSAFYHTPPLLPSQVTNTLTA